MPIFKTRKGEEVNDETQAYYDIKYTLLSQVIFDIFIRLNKSHRDAAITEGNVDGYIGLVNQLDDVLCPVQDAEYLIDINKGIKDAKATVKKVRNFSDAELLEEGADELIYYEARSKFRANCNLIFRALNFYPLKVQSEIL